MLTRYVWRCGKRRRVLVVLLAFVGCHLIMTTVRLWAVNTRNSVSTLKKILHVDTRALDAIKQLARVCLQLPPLQCDSLFLGNRSSAIEVLNSSFSERVGCDFVSLASDCAMFRSTFHYPSKPLSDEERGFPIAYSIRMHKDPVQVEMLLRAIYAPQNIYCVYIDKHSPVEVHRSMAALVSCFDNVFIAKNLKPFYYATSSQMTADLQCMKELSTSDIKWKYYLNLAGQEFPLKTNREIVRVLTILNGTNDIEVGEFVDGLKWRYYKRVVPDGDSWFKFSGVKTDRLQMNITLFKGSSYGAFSREFVFFLLSDPRVQELRHWLSDTFAPEETLFSTANALPGAPGGYSVYVNQDAAVGHHISRLVIWKWTPYPPCGSKYVRAVCILNSSHLNWLILRPQLFANKFDINYDGIAVQCMLQQIIQRQDRGVELNLTYYNSLPHVLFNKKLDKSI